MWRERETMSTITIKDIAKMCGVGVSTVSRAINNHPDINETTRGKIMKVIEEYHFTPNNTARDLKRTQSKTIAILVKGMNNPMFSDMIRIIEKQMEHTQYSFYLQHMEEYQNEIEVAKQLIIEKKVKGIIFLGGSYAIFKERLHEIHVPFVLSTVRNIAYSTEEQGATVCSSISVDDEAESYRLVNYLCKEGHRNIAMLAATKYDESIGNLRLEGYKRALQNNNIAVNDKLILYMNETIPTYTMESGYLLMKKLLHSKEEFTAVFAVSDMVAIGASKAIFEAGKRIPQDYSVAGFDGLESTFYYNPSITTVRQPIKEMAKESVEILLEMIKSKKNVPHKTFEAELMIRESTAFVLQ